MNETFANVVTPKDHEQRRQDRARGNEHRNEGEHRGEHERKHGERAGATDHSLEEHAGSFVVAAAVVGERVEPRQVHRATAYFGSPERAARRLRGGRVLAKQGVRVGARVDEREDRTPVAGEECGVIGRRIRGDAGSRQRPLDARVQSPQVGEHTGRAHRLASRKRDHGHKRGASTAIRGIQSSDRGVRRPTLLVGERGV
jgi:hypothetical protein